MSLKTWKKEFYPIPADKVSKGEALDHSIRKWTGLLPRNLEKHGLIRGGGGVIFAASNMDFCLSVNASTCALCQHADINGTECTGCILCDARRGIPCDRCTSDEQKSPYYEFSHNGKATPMLRWLRYAKRMMSYGSQPEERKKDGKSNSAAKSPVSGDAAQA